jgi:hypothetical protein
MAVPGMPAEHGLYPSMAVGALHAAGLCVSIPEAWSISSERIVAVSTQSPAAGSLAPRGTVVTLVVGHHWPGSLGTPASPIDRKPRPLPDMRGWPLARALDWAVDGRVGYDVEIPPVPPLRARTLLALFRVVGQAPAAGTRMVGRDGDRIRLDVELVQPP